MKAKAFRFLYKRPKEFGWHYLCANYHTKESALELVTRWGDRDYGEWIWRMEEVLTTDFDYPGKSFPQGMTSP